MAAQPILEPAPETDSRSLLRTLAAVVIGLLAGVFAFTAAAGIIGSWKAALPIGALAGGAVVLAFERFRILPAGADPSRGLKVVSAMATVAALAQLVRLAVFIVDPAQAAWSAIPGSKWEVRHSCVSAYYFAGQAAGEGRNVYDESLYSLPQSDPSAARSPRTIGPLTVDLYEYPPPFLLLPRLLARLVPDFFRFNMLWFGFCGLVVLAVMIALVRSVGQPRATRALLLTPLAWAAIGTVSTLQKGNVQLVVIALSMAAMSLFQKRRPALGGALLAFAILGKLYPGLLCLYLLARREWRALFWTAGWGALLLVLTVVDMGTAPFVALAFHLPRLLGGEAFAAFRNPGATAINYSVPGMAFKLRLFGVPGMGFPAAKALGWIYTLVLVPLVVLVARRTLRHGETSQVWLALLILATLRSPFLPQTYATFPALWLLTLLAATRPSSSRTLVMTLLAWVALNLYLPTDWFTPKVLAVATTLPQVVTVLVAVAALRRGRLRSADRPLTLPRR